VLIDMKLGAFVRGQFLLVVLVSVIGIGYLLGRVYVPIAIPIASIAATLVDVVVRGRDPAEEDPPTVLFAGTGEAKR
jgi:hypothetical protein